MHKCDKHDKSPMKYERKIKHTRVPGVGGRGKVFPQKLSVGIRQGWKRLMDFTK